MLQIIVAVLDLDQAFSVQGEKKGTGLMVYLSDVTDFELLRQKYDNEKLCLAYVRFLAKTAIPISRF